MLFVLRYQRNLKRNLNGTFKKLSVPRIILYYLVYLLSIQPNIEALQLVLYSIYVVAKVYWRIMYTLAPKFEANVYISPKLQTWRLMCTLSPNLEAKVNWYM